MTGSECVTGLAVAAPGAALIKVANHSFGITDGIALLALGEGGREAAG